MDPYLKYWVVVPLTSLWAFLSIYGGKKGWKWLVDPPEYLAFVYSQAFVKMLFGTDVTRRYTIVTGWICLAIVVWLLFFV